MRSLDFIFNVSSKQQAYIRLKPKLTNSLVLLTILLLISSLSEKLYADHQTPPWDSVSSTLNYLWPEDSSTFERVTWRGIERHRLIDEGEDGGSSRQSVHVFDSFYDDGVTVKMYIHTDFGDIAAATAAANRFGFILGQTSHELRKGVTNYAYFHLFGGSFWGSQGEISINSNIEGTSSFEEKIISELTHSGIDNGVAPFAFAAARNADNAFITTKARDDVGAHDMNHSFAAWLALRHYRERLSDHDAAAIEDTIPNRLAFFDSRHYKMYPTDNELLEGAWFGNSQVAGDFNNDGFLDLAVGSPYADVDGVNNGGKVDIFYGSTSGLSSVSDQVLHQNTAGISGTAESGDQFGFSLAAGNFGHGNADDLAIGVPGEDAGSRSNSGAVNIIYGSNSGLRSRHNTVWNQASSELNGTLEAGDRFGASLASGNFGYGGRDDLAIGIPGEDAGSLRNAGAVQILYGSTNNGIRANNNTIWNQASAGINGTLESGDQFGTALATGNFGKGGQDDLAIGIPGEDAGSVRDTGAVIVLYGSSNGIRSSGNQLWSQDTAGISGTGEAGDRFGASLAAGIFDNGSSDDLAIGVPGEDAGSLVAAGAVNVIYGGSNGLASSGNQIWNQGSSGISGTLEAGDRFGASITVADFGNGGRDDLAIGVPGEDAGSLVDAGAVNIIYGSSNGLNANSNSIWNLGSNGVMRDMSARDQFGFSLAAGNFGGSSKDDLAIGIPQKNLGGSTDNGMGSVLYGSRQGLSSQGNHPLHGSHHFD